MFSSNFTAESIWSEVHVFLRDRMVAYGRLVEDRVVTYIAFTFLVMVYHFESPLSNYYL